MTLPVYPDRRLLPGITYSQKWSPAFFNQGATSADGSDIDIGIAQYPLHDFELSYAFLRDGPKWGGALEGLELRTMMGFFLATAGSRGRFLYKNIDDCQVFRNQIGVGDGTTTTFPITRTFGANGYFGTEPVGQIDTASGLNVYLGAAYSPTLPTAYSIDTTNPVANTITFNTAPSAGQAISLDMNFWYYCKLPDNAATFEKFMDRLWKLEKVTLHSCRAGT